ncbi:Pycsar system effector family protein [Streptomyces sp. NPDC057702]|uniref:Pycsar system effector family protein n=1 Tax=unclassified Streptomyces TaxID=2593676 RepID=UPI0036B0EA5A
MDAARRTTRDRRGGRLARTLLTETREEMLKADQKANTMLSGLGVTLAALVGAVSAGGVTPLRYGIAAQVLFWLGCAAAFPSLGLLALAVLPRTGTPLAHRAHYFGDVSALGTPGQLAHVVRHTDPHRRDLNQLAVLSQLVVMKYRYVRGGMVWGGAFVALTTVGVLMGADH